MAMVDAPLLQYAQTRLRQGFFLQGSTFPGD